MLESPDKAHGMNKDIRLFLASNSPRRKELLALGGWEYDILSAQVDETPLTGEDGLEYVQRMANYKATTAAIQAGAEGVFIGADTTVIYPQVGETPVILGKPDNPGEALEMLRCLRGGTHQVHTAIFILNSQNGATWSDLCTTYVTMRNYSDGEIKEYIASGDPMDKAGAYAIQHDEFHPVEKLGGCFANVMGLPLCHLTRSLAHFGVVPQMDIPRACQAETGYDCPVYHQILIENM
jgi:septum formation protein